MKVNHICTQNCFTVSYARSVFLSNLWILVSSKLLDIFFLQKTSVCYITKRCCI